MNGFQAGVVGSIKILKSRIDFNFEIEIRREPGSFITLNQSPEILEHVKRNLEIYIRGASADIPLSMKKELARKFFPEVMSYISRNAKRVSSNGDLIFISDGNIEVHVF